MSTYLENAVLMVYLFSQLYSTRNYEVDRWFVLGITVSVVYFVGTLFPCCLIMFGKAVRSSVYVLFAMMAINVILS